MKNAYQKLEERFKRLTLINESIGMLQWDAATIMPHGAASGRAEQLAGLKVMAHEMITHPEMEDLLNQAESDVTSLDCWQQANLREMRRNWVHSSAVPALLVDAFSRAGTMCEMVWREARKDNNFSMLEFPLSNVLKLAREVAAVKAEVLGCDPYDALLDEYEPDGRSAHIDVIFDELAAFLPEFLQKVLDHQASSPAPLPLQGPFPVETQRALGVELMTALGFSFDNGRLDTSMHPFCGGNPEDVRLTTAYDTNNFLNGMMAVLHETGHALYEQGLPSKWRYQPVGSSRGMSIHESQSLAVEMQACRSAAFVKFVTPLLQKHFGVSGTAWQEENLYRHFTHVERGMIRVYADEVTYPAHVIFRYRLEKAMIAGELEIADLPQAWAEGMEALLGVRPPNDRDGCMQDIHWMEGMFGYFPTYTLGAMTAAQLFESALRDDSDILAGIEKGDFSGLLAWMRTHVHSQASSLTTDELLTKATGSALDAQYYIRHLESRYLG